jgi:hypothetical protein
LNVGGVPKLTLSPNPSSCTIPGSTRSISAGFLPPGVPLFSSFVTNAAKHEAIFACSITASSISSKLRMRWMTGASQL